MPEASEKERVLEAVRTLPDEATFEDAIERLCFLAKVEEGLRQAERKEGVGQEEMERRYSI